MSKIAEKKSLKAYPNALIGNLDNLKKDGFIKGYDQAKQDFLEKAEMYLRYRVYYNTHPNNINVAIEDFKNYMQDEM